MFKILVVEDDRELNRAVCAFLGRNGYEAVGCLCAEEAYDALYETVFDLIISDIMMPGTDGFEFARTVREQNTELPILFMTARDDLTAKQRGFSAGADDYMVKPVDLDELLLRIGALLRRAKIASSKRLTAGSLLLDADEHTAYLSGAEVPLTVREFDLLYKLLSYPKKTFTRAQLMEEFWEMETSSGPRTVDVYITKLRDKFSACPDFEIVTVHGAGRFPRYLFSATKFLIFFALIAFVVTCSFLLFLDSMRLDPDILRENALLTFLNILLLSALFTVIDGIRRRLTVERPVRRIRAATQRIIQGDFSVRIEPLHGPERADAFDAIIEDFNQMARELSGVETLRTDFIANVSHELKTPLAVIQNYGSLLQDPALPKEQRVEYAKAVTDASRRLADLIANILKLNKLENQQIFPQAETYDLGEQLRECLLGFEDAWEAKELAVEADIPDGVAVRTDRELLTLVWNNLFSNAVKFTDAGGSIHVSLRHTGTQAEVCVTDTGCGMSPETGRHIFEKFYQGDSSHATQGNGLGLALVRRVVDIVGGEIAVKSTLGKGSTFSVVLRAETNETP